MTVYLLTEHPLEFLSLKGGLQARLSLHLSKCHIVGNYMSRLVYVSLEILAQAIGLSTVDSETVEYFDDGIFRIRTCSF